MEMLLCPRCLLPMPVQASLLPHSQDLPARGSGEGDDGEFQVAFNSSFYELFTFHFKDEKTEAQRCKWFCKKALLL